MKKVLTRWVVALVPGTRVSVKKGDRLTKGQEIAREFYSSENLVSLASLTDSEIQKFKDIFIGNEVQQGQLLWESGKIFHKRIVSNYGGKVVRVDEFKNAFIKKPETETGKILCPTEAIVDEVGDDNITLKFEAVEFNGKGLNEARAWAENGVKAADKLSDINALDADKILLLPGLVSALLLKAEVIGAKGIVVPDSGDKVYNDRISISLPTLVIPESDFEILRRKSGVKQRLMINAANGRLLAII